MSVLKVVLVELQSVLGVVVLLIFLFLIFFLLYLHFRNLAEVMIILLTIPFSLVGGVWLMYLLDYNMSVAVAVGFIALFGIALENGMVLVTYLNQLVRQGMDVSEASVKGAMLRLRPVLMTAAIAALGLIPMLLATGVGSEVQRPLATVVVGGLVSSTFLTLFVVPALYGFFSHRADLVVSPSHANRHPGG